MFAQVLQRSFLLKISLICAGLQIPSFWAGASDVAEENTWKWVSDDTQVVNANP